jgi:hypothetical protein
MSPLEHLLAEASNLPEDQRFTLAHRLLTSTEPEATEEAEQAWDLEIRKRIDKYDRGEGRSRPASEVLAQLDRHLAK